MHVALQPPANQCLAFIRPRRHDVEFEQGRPHADVGKHQHGGPRLPFSQPDQLPEARLQRDGIGDIQLAG